MPSRKKPSAQRTKPNASPAAIVKATTPHARTIPPARVHSSSYHYPLLLDDEASRDALLKWFEGEEEARNMPWRKRWIDPEVFEGTEEELGQTLARRAYEVWVSEVMLQQTRVSTVIPYFKTWISKWPTVQDLAKASHDEVLSVWKGLGYYSRATRLHQGAQAMVAQNSGPCPIPSNAIKLKNFPGIGRYTAGAISSIAFGEPEPVLDGNVSRVLSRQLGLYVDVKDKKATDILWEMADQLVKRMAGYPIIEKSRIPGQVNQALMELGSTICTPRPKCGECPIRKSCRAYAEGETLAKKAKSSSAVPDIEDACSLCEQLDTEALATAPDDDEEDKTEKVGKKRKHDQRTANTISNYFTISTPSPTPLADAEDDEIATGTGRLSSKKRKNPTSSDSDKSIATYCSLFPKKAVKKKAAEEECVVCIIQLQLPGASSKWLIERRPAKGLLASLWQFPQSPLPKSTSNTSATHRKTSAQKYVSSLHAGHIDMSKAIHVGEPDSLVHVFSHLKLTMHVHLFALRVEADKAEELDCAIEGTPARKWVDTDSMDDETLSTGMKTCWELVMKKKRA